MSGAQLFVVWHGAPSAEISLGDDVHSLAEGMFMVRSERTLSRLYHAIKHQLPADTALIVTPTGGDPKFKGMAEGALKWLRSGA
ncbi:hypothetical protein [Poseidonocella sedimentorum]|uniref:Uncharacterized protein n=1 Tax=Poseidonocella sedimentorum TaxID=871652 RepID=A0A1I6DGI1_9RHOB|nr:hypothetical protein [Poseidonocella sedimentorum]SFR04491.1 hypothetical protein SAMN04515673_103185 [Poseidonocella sedimentorum]